MDRRVRLGTRGSRLAVAQSGAVARDLERVSAAAGYPLTVDLVRITTHGDTDRSPLRRQGGVGVFTTRLRHALHDGQCDLAVHSLKDLPVAPEPGLALAVPTRLDPRDALCARDGLTLAQLPPRPRIGTGSPRRAAQLVLLRPDVRIVDVRGNVPTRLARVGKDLDAVVLAAAGLARLGLEHAITQVLDPATMLPAAAQGALAVEYRCDADPILASAVAALEDRPSRLAVRAERALMRGLQAGCAAPVGALARLAPDGSLRLEGGVAPLGPPGPTAPPASVGPAHGPVGMLRCVRSVVVDEGDPGSERTAERLGADVARDLLDAGASRIVDVRASTLDRLPGEGPS